MTPATIWLAVLVVSALFAIMQGVHPGPLIKISAELGSKPLPVRVSVNCCPGTGGLVDVVSCCNAGVVVEFDTWNVYVPDCCPSGFWTTTVHCPTSALLSN